MAANVKGWPDGPVDWGDRVTSDVVTGWAGHRWRLERVTACRMVAVEQNRTPGAQEDRQIG